MSIPLRGYSRILPLALLSLACGESTGGQGGSGGHAALTIMGRQTGEPCGRDEHCNSSHCDEGVCAGPPAQAGVAAESPDATAPPPADAGPIGAEPPTAGDSAAPTGARWDASASFDAGASLDAAPDTRAEPDAASAPDAATQDAGPAGPCQPNPCLNGARCDPDSTGQAPQCTCAKGFSGPLCEVDEDDCMPTNPCLNGGSCVDGPARFYCLCAEGYEGRFCQRNIDDCVPPPCLNGGTCIDQVAGFSCRCTAGFGGDRCQLTQP